MKIVLEPGESREEMLTALSSVVRDDVNKAIVRYVLENEEHAYLRGDANSPIIRCQRRRQQSDREVRSGE